MVPKSTFWEFDEDYDEDCDKDYDEDLARQCAPKTWWDATSGRVFGSIEYHIARVFPGIDRRALQAEVLRRRHRFGMISLDDLASLGEGSAWSAKRRPICENYASHCPGVAPG